MLIIEDNSSINTQCIPQERVLNIANTDDYISFIKQYKQITFKPFSEKYLNALTTHNNQSLYRPVVFNYLQSMPGRFFSSKDRDLHYLSTILEAQLAVPRAHFCHPIIDKLWFTVPATDEEVSRFTRLIKRKEHKKFCRLEMRPRKSRTEEPEIYTDCYHFVFANKSDHRIVVYCDTNGRGKRQNKMKFAFNPARFSRRELRKFFGWLERSKVFTNYHQTLFNSKVTRLDIAIDFFGVPTPMFMMKFSKSAKTNFYPAEDDEFWELVQTIVCGHPKRSHYDVYDRIIKFLQGRTVGLVGLNARGRPIPITRFERSYRPQQSNGSGLLLGNLVRAPDIWKSVMLLSPHLLSEIRDTENLANIARQGFAHWYSDQEKYGNALPKSVLKRHALWVNRPEFQQMQQKALNEIKKTILTPCKRRNNRKKQP